MKKAGFWAAWLLSVVFHPIFIPFYTVVLYFSISSFYFFDDLKLLRLIFLTTILVPLLLQLVLYNLKLLRSFFLGNMRARIYFTLMMAVIYAILYRSIRRIPVLDELSSFFIGISVSLLVAVAFNVFFRKKISLHLLAMGGSLVFLLHWALMHRINILDLVALTVLLTGLLAMARYTLKAHSLEELLWGWLGGMGGMALALWVF